MESNKSRYYIEKVLNFPFLFSNREKDRLNTLIKKYYKSTTKVQKSAYYKQIFMILSASAIRRDIPFNISLEGNTDIQILFRHMYNGIKVIDVSRNQEVIEKSFIDFIDACTGVIFPPNEAEFLLRSAHNFFIKKQKEQEFREIIEQHFLRNINRALNKQYNVDSTKSYAYTLPCIIRSAKKSHKEKAYKEWLELFDSLEANGLLSNLDATYLKKYFTNNFGHNYKKVSFWKELTRETCERTFRSDYIVPSFSDGYYSYPFASLKAIKEQLTKDKIAIYEMQAYKNLKEYVAINKNKISASDIEFLLRPFSFSKEKRDTLYRYNSRFINDSTLTLIVCLYNGNDYASKYASKLTSADFDLIRKIFYPNGDSEKKMEELAFVSHLALKRSKEYYLKSFKELLLALMLKGLISNTLYLEYESIINDYIDGKIQYDDLLSNCVNKELKEYMPKVSEKEITDKFKAITLNVENSHQSHLEYLSDVVAVIMKKTGSIDKQNIETRIRFICGEIFELELFPKNEASSLSERLNYVFNNYEIEALGILIKSEIPQIIREVGIEGIDDKLEELEAYYRQYASTIVEANQEYKDIIECPFLLTVQEQEECYGLLYDPDSRIRLLSIINRGVQRITDNIIYDYFLEEHKTRFTYGIEANYDLIVNELKKAYKKFSNFLCKYKIEFGPIEYPNQAGALSKGFISKFRSLVLKKFNSFDNNPEYISIVDRITKGDIFALYDYAKIVDRLKIEKISKDLDVTINHFLIAANQQLRIPIDDKTKGSEVINIIRASVLDYCENNGLDNEAKELRELVIDSKTLLYATKRIADVANGIVLNIEANEKANINRLYDDLTLDWNKMVSALYNNGLIDEKKKAEFIKAYDMYLQSSYSLIKESGMDPRIANFEGASFSEIVKPVLREIDELISFSDINTSVEEINSSTLKETLVSIHKAIEVIVLDRTQLSDLTYKLCDSKVAEKRIHQLFSIFRMANSPKKDEEKNLYIDRLDASARKYGFTEAFDKLIIDFSVKNITEYFEDLIQLLPELKPLAQRMSIAINLNDRALFRSCFIKLDEIIDRLLAKDPGYRNKCNLVEKHEKFGLQQYLSYVNDAIRKKIYSDFKRRILVCAKQLDIHSFGTTVANNDNPEETITIDYGSLYGVSLFTDFKNAFDELEASKKSIDEVKTQIIKALMAKILDIYNRIDRSSKYKMLLRKQYNVLKKVLVNLPDVSAKLLLNIITNTTLITVDAIEHNNARNTIEDMAKTIVNDLNSINSNNILFDENDKSVKMWVNYLWHIYFTNDYENLDLGLIEDYLSQMYAFTGKNVPQAHPELFISPKYSFDREVVRNLQIIIHRFLENTSDMNVTKNMLNAFNLILGSISKKEEENISQITEFVVSCMFREIKDRLQILRFDEEYSNILQSIDGSVSGVLSHIKQESKYCIQPAIVN